MRTTLISPSRSQIATMLAQIRTRVVRLMAALNALWSAQLNYR